MCYPAPAAQVGWQPVTSYTAWLSAPFPPVISHYCSPSTIIQSSLVSLHQTGVTFQLADLSTPWKQLEFLVCDTQMRVCSSRITMCVFRTPPETPQKPELRYPPTSGLFGPYRRGSEWLEGQCEWLEGLADPLG